MWIRSQDRTTLAKVATISIAIERERNEVSIFGENIESYSELGTYSTEERAKEVIKEIQRKIKREEKTYSMPER